MAAELYDCPWCGSAKSIEHGLCQVCMMEFPVDTKVIALPTTRASHPSARPAKIATPSATRTTEAAQAD